MILKTAIDRTNIEVSNIGFGTASLHHIFLKKNRVKLLNHVFDIGVKHFDTSPYYGDGIAELDLCSFLNEKRSKVTITTKIGLYPHSKPSNSTLNLWSKKFVNKIVNKIILPEVNYSVDKAKQSLHLSLKRLGTEYIDFLFLHEPNIWLLQTDEMINWLEKERSKGVIREFGLAGVRDNIEHFINTNNPLCKVIQTKDSICDKEADFLLKKNIPFQFTYGYLSSFRKSKCNYSVSEIIQKATLRNNTGCIILSSNNLHHINELLSFV